jgi:regulator of protease activity HflC (stomatin/prohibitin superfamily)
MKQIRINKGTIGLVFRKGEYRRVMTDGKHWLKWEENVIVYDLAKPFYPTVDLNLLLADQQLAEKLTIEEVKDNEIALQYVNGNYKGILQPGRYAFWKGHTTYSFLTADLSKIEITEEIPMNILLKPEVLQYIRVYQVESYEKGILLINGKIEKTMDKGTYYFWKNPTSISVIKTDLRKQQMEIPGQEILTKDKAALRINFFAHYKTVDIDKALIENKEFEKQLYVLIQLAIREYVGMNTLDELLERKEAVSEAIKTSISEKASVLGVEIGDCGIRDIILPGEVKEIMNQVLVAEKRAQANIVTRREETASTRSLLNTAKLMEENAMLFKLKEMEYVEKIAEKVNNISLSGGGLIIDQLKGLFVTSK